MVTTETLPQIENRSPLFKRVLTGHQCPDHFADNFRRAVYLFVERTVRQKKELGWASPGLLDPSTHLRTWGTYGVATTSPAASVYCFVNLPPQQVLGGRQAHDFSV
jgi:hypothetical protein